MRNTDDSHTLTGDPVIRELWAVKDAMAADCGYNVQELFRRIRARQEASGREYVRLTPPHREAGADRNPGTN